MRGMGRKGEGFSGTSIKDIGTKPTGRWDQGWEVVVAGVGGKSRQLYLNNNKKRMTSEACILGDRQSGLD